MKISVSMLSSYLYCARKLFLQKVLEFEEPPKESLVLGSIRHEVYDYINKKEEQIVSSILEKTDHNSLKDLYKKSYVQKVREVVIKNKPRMRQVNLGIVDAFKRTWPYIMNEAEIRAENIFSFIQENNVYGKELWEKLTPKILSEMRIESEKLQLRGIIDKVEVYEDGYVPIELKTGKMPREGMWPGHRIQITAYALMLEEKFNVPIKEGFVHYLDVQEKRHLAMNPFMKEEIISLVKEIQALLQKNNIPEYCENKNKCVNCGLKEQCFNEKEMNTLIKENI
ncbi:CRISPR-associated protein Cas4 [Candidatus Woesearchaeota archaeon]|nr:CRISPR-associated protein Cas4 [Candidatus Woesearchaeota archaeon]|tara:strand:+ start:114 stop:959 length:846 start_codon:yes stop_codon:yes gene_type:complete